MSSKSAWNMLREMRGRLSYNNQMNKWTCSAPNGVLLKPDVPDLILGDADPLPGNAVRNVYALWVEAGSPQWPEINDE